jgi:AraC family transcriptional regulator of adaptative response/methylated-DNA-[protein]-cysteine methyltransferase
MDGGSRGRGSAIMGAEVVSILEGRCWLGSILVAVSAVGLRAILLGDDADTLRRDLQRRLSGQRDGRSDAFDEVMPRVVDFVHQPARGLDWPLDVRGTAFQERVWAALRAIEPGTTASYAEVAARIGRVGASRAVAGACAANPLAVAIPCHRVVRSDGSLSGYRWGVARKEALLRRERGEV